MIKHDHYYVNSPTTSKKNDTKRQKMEKTIKVQKQRATVPSYLCTSAVRGHQTKNGNPFMDAHFLPLYARAFIVLIEINYTVTSHLRNISLTTSLKSRQVMFTVSTGSAIISPIMKKNSSILYTEYIKF